MSPPSRDYPSSLRVAIVCPAPAGSRLGNRITAERWRRLLEQLGHDAFVIGDGDEPACDVLVALHARRSAQAVASSREHHAARPIVVALTGTDLYGDLATDASARRSVELADRLVVLHDLAIDDLPAELRAKTRVIRQSAEPPAPVTRASDAFEVALVAHARAEKDPLRAPLAARALPPSSRVRVVHAGRALTPEMEAALRREERENPRYVWLREIAPNEARALLARARLAVLTSELEGGANVIGEAVVAGTPVLATRIPACVAALGADYPGFFSVGDTAALTALLARAEGDAAFFGALTAATDARRDLFAPATEREAWRRLLAELV